MKKKKDQSRKGTGEKKERELRKTISQLKAQIRQERKMRMLAEEEVIRLQDIVQDADALEVARKISRGKRKHLTECSDCGIVAVTEESKDLGARFMVVRFCTNCGTHFDRRFERKE